MNERISQLSQLLHIKSSRQQYRLATGVAATILLISAAAMPFGTLQLVEVKPFLPAFIAWFLFGDLLTAYMLFSQYRAGRSRPLLILACTYLYTGLIIIPHILTFPGVFSDTGLLGAGNQSVVWL